MNKKVKGFYGELSLTKKRKRKKLKAYYLQGGKWKPVGKIL